MGNTIASDYLVSKKQSASGGNELLWKIYHCTHKETGEKSSLFLLQKEDIPEYLRNSTFFNLLHNASSNLLKVSHPHILKLLKPIQETRSEFLMLCEPVDYCLSNVVGKRDHLPPESLVFEEFSETEIKNGIRQICEGAMYCHDNQISHSNINPSSIFISPSRDWKLAGFEFSRSIESGRAAVGWDYETFSTVTSPLMPPINFAAPEIVQHKEIRSKSDAFSIGILAICLYNFENFSEFKDEISSFSDYAAFLDLLENNSYFDGKIDFQKNKKSILINLLKVDSEKRFSIQDFLDSDFFLEKELIVLRDCEHFSTFNEMRKTNLLENVSQNLSLFNEKIIVLKIVPVLTSALEERELCLTSLKSIFWIIEHLSEKRNFKEKILKPVTQLFTKKNHEKIWRYLIENLTVFLEMCEQSDFDNYVINFLASCLSHRSVILVTETLKALQKILTTDATFLTLPKVKKKLLPVMMKLLLIPKVKNSNIVRTCVLICLAKLLQHFFSDNLVKQITEIVEKSTKIEFEPDVVMSAICLYDNAVQFSNSKIIANVLLPKISPLITVSGLITKQKNKIYELLKICLNKIEEEYYEESTKEENEHSSQKDTINLFD